MKNRTIFVKEKVKKDHVGKNMICIDKEGNKYFGEIKYSSGQYCVKFGNSSSWPIISFILNEDVEAVNANNSDTSIARRIIEEELREGNHVEKVEDVIFWALEYYSDKEAGTYGASIAYWIKERILEAEKEVKNG